MEKQSGHSGIFQLPGSLCFMLLAAITIFPNTIKAQQTNHNLPPWKEGFLDIHHISTGRGDAAFLIFPDGTTLLIDAGDTSETHPRTLSPRNTPLLPDRSKTAPEWIVDYIKNFFPQHRDVQLDYAIITHYHDDHFGEIDASRKLHPEGNYQLTGITAVGSLIPIHNMIDRGSDFPVDYKDPKIQKVLSENDSYGMIATLKNYWQFIDYQSAKNRLEHSTLIPGKKDQLKLLHAPDKFPSFSIRNIAVNGKIWTGEEENYYQILDSGNYVGENPLSTCIKISYGAFDYFTGGDISGVDGLGNTDFDRMESHVAPVIGPVDVATLNHHGNRDSQNAFYVRTIRPRIWIGQTWSSDHPDNNVLRRLLSTDLYPGERDLFATAMLQANAEVIGSMVNQYKSQNGHVVVRVENGGATYQIFILDSASEEKKVLATFGEYLSR